MAGVGSSTSTADQPGWYQIAGITLAVLAGFFTGSSMILQKKGLINTRKVVLETGNEFAYLKSVHWWLGILSLSLGEVCNFVAYAFSPAILVAPLMAISVVVSAIMSVIYLDEKLNFTATAGIILCLLGSTIIVLHAPTSTTTKTIPEFYTCVFSPGFLVYFFLSICLMAYLVLRLGPRYGHVHPAVYISITAIGGAYLVSSAQGLGAAILYSITNWETDNQFLLWPLYPLLGFVIITVIFQVNYLNKALACFSASIVTPLNYVFFSTATILTSSVLYKGFNVDSAVIAITIVMGFFVIVVGVSLLFQYNLKMSKMALLSRHIEDINDEDVVVETPADDDPIKLMRQVFPVKGAGPRTSRVRPLKTSSFSQSPIREMESKELYVRPEDSEPVPAANTTSETLVINNMVPKVSLSQQIEYRENFRSNQDPTTNVGGISEIPQSLAYPSIQGQSPPFQGLESTRPPPITVEIQTIPPLVVESSNPTHPAAAPNGIKLPPINGPPPPGKPPKKVSPRLVGAYESEVKKSESEGKKNESEGKKSESEVKKSIGEVESDMEDEKNVGLGLI